MSSTFAEDLLKLTNPLPVLPDTEDFGDYAVRRSSDNRASDVIGDGPVRRTVLLDNEDLRYTGRKVSRKQLGNQSAVIGNHSSDNESNNNDDDDDSVESGVSGSDADGDDDFDEDDDEDPTNISRKRRRISNKSISREAVDNDSNDAQNDDDEDDDDDDEDDDDDDEDDDDDDDDDQDYDEDDPDADIEPGHLEGNTKSVAQGEQEKGRATVLQLELWDSMMKALMRIHACLNHVNQLPQPPHTWSLFKSQVTDYQATAVGAQRALKTLLDELVSFQTDLMSSNPETASIVNEKAGRGSEVTDDNEEIPSDSDMEVDEDEERKALSKKRKKHRMQEYPELLAKRHKGFEKYRNSTIEKWTERVSSKGFSAFEQSSVKQIQQIMNDMPKLIARSRVKQSSYRVLGKEEPKPETPAPEGEENALPVTRAASVKEYDDEIFDDQDFYHRLIQELIQRKDPTSVSREYLEIQKQRKIKRNIDTKASKGRRIRYNVHRKLVNFLAPVQIEGFWSEEQIDDRVHSVFTL